MENQEENVNAILEQSQEIVQPEQVDNQQDESQVDSQVTQSSDKEMNFKKLRESKEYYERRVKELEAQQNQNTKPHQPKPFTEELGVDDDDLIDGKAVKKIVEKLSREFEQKLEKQRAQDVPDKLRSKFSDIDQVVTQENLEKLQQLEPELYQTIISGNDMYAKGVAAYKTIKKMGIAMDDQTAEVKTKINSNLQKPGSSQSLNKTSNLAHADSFTLTADMKAKYRKEMAEAMKAHY